MKVRGVVLLSSYASKYCEYARSTRVLLCCGGVRVSVAPGVVGPVQVVKIVNVLILVGMAYNSSIRRLSVGCRRSWLAKVVEMVVGNGCRWVVVRGCSALLNYCALQGSVDLNASPERPALLQSTTETTSTTFSSAFIQHLELP